MTISSFVKKLEHFLEVKGDSYKLNDILDNLEDKIFKLEANVSKEEIIASKMIKKAVKNIDTIRTLLENDNSSEKELSSELVTLIYLLIKLEKKVKIPPSGSTQIKQGVLPYNSTEILPAVKQKEDIPEPDFKQPLPKVVTTTDVRMGGVMKSQENSSDGLKLDQTKGEFKHDLKMERPVTSLGALQVMGIRHAINKPNPNFVGKSTFIPRISSKVEISADTDLHISPLDSLIVTAQRFIKEDSSFMDFEDMLEEVRGDISEISKNKGAGYEDNNDKTEYLETIEDILDLFEYIRESIEKNKLRKDIDSYIKELSELSKNLMSLQDKLLYKKPDEEEIIDKVISMIPEDAFTSGNFEIIEEMVYKLSKEKEKLDEIDDFLEKILENARVEKEKYEKKYINSGRWHMVEPSIGDRFLREGSAEIEEGINYLYDNYKFIDEDIIETALDKLFEGNRKLLITQYFGEYVKDMTGEK